MDVLTVTSDMGIKEEPALCPPCVSFDGHSWVSAGPRHRASVGETNTSLHQGSPSVSNFLLTSSWLSGQPGQQREGSHC